MSAERQCCKRRLEHCTTRASIVDMHVPVCSVILPNDSVHLQQTVLSFLFVVLILDPSQHCYMQIN
jgi:hypothetical protein